MDCQILPMITPSIIMVTEGWAVALTTIPVTAPITWGGDLGDQPEIFQDGHSFTTRWGSPGTKTLTATCVPSTVVFNVIVLPCRIWTLDPSNRWRDIGAPVLIVAETNPRASYESTEPARKLDWSGDIGPEPRFFGNALLTHWEVAGSKNITATCGGVASADITIIVEQSFGGEDNIWLSADARRKNAKRIAAESSGNWGIVGGVFAVVTGVAAAARGPAVWVARAAIMSGGAWILSSMKSKAAIDPPRDDFDNISLFGGLQFDLPPPVDTSDETLLRFVRNMVTMSVCLSDLVRSFERLDGALAVGANAGTSSDLLALPFVRDQIAAVVHNSSSGADLMRDIFLSTSATNAAVQAIVDPFRPTGLTGLSAEVVRAGFR